MTDSEFTSASKPIVVLLTEIRDLLKSRPAQASGAQTGGYKPSTGPLTGWRAYVLTFSKNKGTPLGKLNEKQLQWYMENCKGEGYKGAPPRQSDLDLKAALDAAKAELYPANQAPASDRSPAPTEGQQAGPDPRFTKDDLEIPF